MPYVIMIVKDDMDLCITELLDINSEITDKVLKKRIDYVIKTLSNGDKNFTSNLGILVDSDTNNVRVSNKTFKLTKTQCKVLEMFVKDGLNKLITFRDIAINVLDMNDNINIDYSIRNNIAVHIRYVNKKLKEFSKFKIESCRSSGYELVKG